MKRQASDRRTRRTHQQLRAALIDLILDRGYAAVTVQDILDRADVGRSTFYSHFYDKEDLLLSGFDELHRQFAAQAEGTGSLLSMGIFAHAELHTRLYAALVGERGGELILRKAERSFVAAIEGRLGALAAEGVALPPREGLANAVAGALLGLLRWWLDSGAPLPASEMEARFQRMALGMLGRRSDR